MGVAMKTLQYVAVTALASERWMDQLRPAGDRGAHAPPSRRSCPQSLRRRPTERLTRLRSVLLRSDRGAPLVQQTSAASRIRQIDDRTVTNVLHGVSWDSGDRRDS